MVTNKHFGAVLRQCLSSQVISSSMYRAEGRVRPNRPDLVLQQEIAQRSTQQLSQLLHRYRGRPSLIHPLLRTLGTLWGVAAAAGPSRVGATINSALVDTIAESYDQQLRELYESGEADEVPEIRAAIKQCRDMLPVVEGGVKAPDLLELQQGGLHISPLQGLAAAVKWSLGTVLQATKRL